MCGAARLPLLQSGAEPVRPRSGFVQDMAERLPEEGSAQVFTDALGKPQVEQEFKEGFARRESNGRDAGQPRRWAPGWRRLPARQVTGTGTGRANAGA